MWETIGGIAPVDVPASKTGSNVIHITPLDCTIDQIYRVRAASSYGWKTAWEICIRLEPKVDSQNLHFSLQRKVIPKSRKI